MFIEQGIRKENKFWKYLVGSLLIIIASMIGQVPLVVAIKVKTFFEGRTFPTDQNEVMTIFDSNVTLFLIMVSFVFAIAGIYFVLRFIHQQSMQEIITTRRKIDWNRIGFSFMIWAVLTVFATVVDYYLNPNDFVVNFKPLPFLCLLIIATVMIPIQTTCEELVFRGYLMQGFGNLGMTKWFPLAMTSIIFGTMHILNPEVDKIGYVILVYYIGTGLFLGIITLMDEGMELSLGFHASNNLIGALLVTTDWSVFQTNSVLKDISEPSVFIDTILPVVIIYPILLFIFSKKYHWLDWKGKLTGKITLETIGNHE
ncbi:CPBP family intramembrane glutamic endopeptidase [Flavobacterium sp.]|uniref:CPBP family intramembrane glutamic endopeptidase n=1 Tax=Flavobacterium sp. TaxID=239 RepID=UPI00286C79A9|nr:CPBP family intramembrane glutamic endopeptidase [Flavobacterium sp.]